MITLQCGEEQVLLWVNPEEIQVETGALHKIVETACGEVIQTGPNPGACHIGNHAARQRLSMAAAGDIACR